METRKANLIVNTPGGTAGKGTKTYKVALPTSWINRLTSDKEVDLIFDGSRIILQPRLTLDEFAAKCSSLNHDVKKFSFYDEDELCTVIIADFTDEIIQIKNYVDDYIRTAFGNNSNPSWDDLMWLIGDRLISSSRDGINYYLEVIGLDEYESIEMLRRTSGRMAEDNHRLIVEDI